jgi:hypothetical protein
MQKEQARPLGRAFILWQKIAPAQIRLARKGKTNLLRGLIVTLGALLRTFSFLLVALDAGGVERGLGICLHGCSRSCGMAIGAFFVSGGKSFTFLRGMVTAFALRGLRVLGVVEFDSAHRSLKNYGTWGLLRSNCKAREHYDREHDQQNTYFFHNASNAH